MPRKSPKSPLREKSHVNEVQEEVKQSNKIISSENISEENRSDPKITTEALDPSARKTDEVDLQPVASVPVWSESQVNDSGDEESSKENTNGTDLDDRNRAAKKKGFFKIFCLMCFCS